jgi:hypothetical protein
MKNLHKYIADQKNKNRLRSDKPDLWDELHDDVKADVDLAIKELDHGRAIAHEQVMSKYQKWLKK